MSAPSALRTYLEMIKFEHSIFALPFAMIGMMWGSIAARGSAWPGATVFWLVIIAMVSCRSAAMAFNRIADRDIDAINPRTATRAIPAGLLTLSQAHLYFGLSVMIFLVASWLLGPLCLYLSPVALLTTLGYSRTKRFTSLCHFVLGLSLGIAPTAAWIASTGSLDIRIVLLTLAVLGWTAGFDIIYSLQDDQFDREQGLHSVPVRLGRSRALLVSRICHVAAVAFLAAAGRAVGAGVLYFVGVVFAGALLIYEQSLVKPDDLRKVNMAFFTLNGFVSIGVFLFTLADVATRVRG